MDPLGKLIELCIDVQSTTSPLVNKFEEGPQLKKDPTGSVTETTSISCMSKIRMIFRNLGNLGGLK